MRTFSKSFSAHKINVQQYNKTYKKNTHTHTYKTYTQEQTKDNHMM